MAESDPGPELRVVEAQAAPTTVTVLYCDEGSCTDPGSVEIWIDDPNVTEVDVTVKSFSDPEPWPLVWDWYVNDGIRYRERPYPSEVTFTLTIELTQSEALYTIKGRTRYHGWGEDTLQIILLRASPTS